MKQANKATSAFQGILVIVILFLYWTYLAFVTEPTMVYDAKGYQDLARMIVDHGWKEYFISGPNREPIYPFIIAATMKIAGIQTYLGLLKFLQITFLFMSAIMLLSILRRSSVPPTIATIAVFYLGISPALVNSALSVYSEIATYIFVLSIVALGAKSYLELQDGKPAWMWGAGFAACFVFATLVKSSYEIIFYFCLVPFLMIVWKRRNRKVIREALSFLIVTLVIFHAAIGGYKYLNKAYNGLFVLTDRAAWAFYGTATRREVPLKTKDFGIAVTYKLLEEGGCRTFYTADECRDWDVTTADQFSEEKNYEVIAKFSPEKQNRELMKASLAKIMENPWQYGLLMSLDWIRLFFWESTRIGFVTYPDGIDAILDQPIFAKGLRLFIGLLSLAAFVFCILYVIKDRKPQCRSLHAVMLFTTCVTFCHVTLYSLFFTIPRFSLPIAPLFIVMMALSAHILTRKEKL